MAAMARDNYGLAMRLANVQMEGGHTIAEYLWQLIGDQMASKESLLLAGICIANLYKSGAIQGDCPKVAQQLLPTLSGLMDTPGMIGYRSMVVLAYLIGDNPALQRETIGCHSIGKLASILRETGEYELNRYSEYGSGHSSLTLGRYSQLKEGVFIALAAIASSQDDCRKLILESGVLKYAAKSLRSSSAAERAAACQCIRSLSRSAKALRTSLVDENVLGPMLSLLDDDDSMVKISACASICNLILDFSPMKSVKHVYTALCLPL